MTKQISALFLILSLLLASSCIGIRNRDIVRSGVLRLGVNNQAFLDVWGRPDRIRTEAGEETMSANWTGFRQGFFKGRRPVEVWTYETIGVDLAFSGGNLAGWKTNKTVDELRAFSEQQEKRQ